MRDAVAGASLMVLLVGTVAWAHEAAKVPVTDPVTVSAPDTATPTTDASGLLLAGLVAGIVPCLARPRRLTAALVIILVILAFETGLHSTHHLNDPARASACTVAILAVHLVGSPVDNVSVDLIGSPAHRPISPEPERQVPHSRPAPHEGRAPPASHA
jgi:hypothetical protein